MYIRIVFGPRSRVEDCVFEKEENKNETKQKRKKKQQTQDAKD